MVHQFFNYTHHQTPTTVRVLATMRMVRKSMEQYVTNKTIANWFKSRFKVNETDQDEYDDDPQLVPYIEINWPRRIWGRPTIGSLHRKKTDQDEYEDNPQLLPYIERNWLRRIWGRPTIGSLQWKKLAKSKSWIKYWNWFFLEFANYDDELAVNGELSGCWDLLMEIQVQIGKLEKTKMASLLQGWQRSSQCIQVLSSQKKCKWKCCSINN